MKLSHIVLIIYLGLIIGSILIFFFGDEGHYRYMLLTRHRDKLMDNLDNLKNINNGLHRQLESLRTSPEIIRLLARELGYYGSDETVITLNGQIPVYNFYEVGKLFQKVHISKHRDLILRVIGIVMSTLCVLLFIVLKKRNRHGHKRG